MFYSGPRNYIRKLYLNRQVSTHCKEELSKVKAKQRPNDFKGSELLITRGIQVQTTGGKKGRKGLNIEWLE